MHLVDDVNNLAIGIATTPACANRRFVLPHAPTII